MAQFSRTWWGQRSIVEKLWIQVVCQGRLVQGQVKSPDRGRIDYGLCYQQSILGCMLFHHHDSGSSAYWPRRLHAACQPDDRCSTKCLTIHALQTRRQFSSVSSRRFHITCSCPDRRTPVLPRAYYSVSTAAPVVLLL